MADKKTESTASASQKILNVVESILAKFETLPTKTEIEEIKSMQQEIIKRIEAIQTTLTIKRSTKAGASNPVPDKRPFPANSLTWIKMQWATNRDGVIAQFFTDNHIKKMNDDFARDARKDMDGDARNVEEIKYLWREAVLAKNDDSIKNAIMKAFEEAKKKNMELMKTPVVKEDE
jgi:hypothetical protein